MEIKRINTSGGECLMIDNRYAIYNDGVIYDTEKAKDIPSWIFEMKEFFLDNYNNMKCKCGEC